MIAFMANFAAEYPIGIAGVSKDDRQHDTDADQHENLARGRRGSVPDRNRRWYQIRKHADAQPNEPEQEYGEREQEWRQFRAPFQAAHEQRRNNRNEDRDGRSQVNTGRVQPAREIIIAEEWGRRANGRECGQCCCTEPWREPKAPLLQNALCPIDQPARPEQRVADDDRNPCQQTKWCEPVPPAATVATPVDDDSLQDSPERDTLRQRRLR